jgi:TrmH family RNA methyltransferase
MKLISSRDNEKIKHARAVRDGKVRSQIFIEGIRLSQEAINAKLNVAEVFVNENDLHDERISQLTDEHKEKIIVVSERVFESLSETKSSQGLVLIATRPPYNHEVLSKLPTQNPLIVILHRTNNPANAGAIVRVAEAAGVDGLISTKGSTYLFSPKALRGAMGSTFRLPIWSNVSFDEAIAWCRNRKITTVCADAKAETTINEFDWNKPVAIILGEEGSGLTEDEIAKTDVSIKIPMKAPVESLNVAVAAGIILYQATGQRNSQSV